MFSLQRHCRLWNPEKRRDGYNIGRYAKQRCRLRGHARTRTMRQIQQNTTVHYLVSPPRPPRKTNPQAKATF
ncbi:hypothetical protein IVZ55_20765 [Salmonella enterica subsp. enterica serovar Worthington]|nr:hypothetical protein [Salmonella enterica subsp. enterica serovar Worthington]MBP1523835.1 hypothetical protein [Salmonella enterica subsp. enterica serovar Worthington]MBZ3661519.1 hypothetical protein [Salmonella enterica subsp. enterica serovar Kentucky]